MASEKLEIVITGKDQTKGMFGKLKNNLGGLGGLVGKAAIAGIGAATVAVGALGAATLALAKDAATLGPIKESFEGIAEASGQISYRNAGIPE